VKTTNIARCDYEFREIAAEKNKLWEKLKILKEIARQGEDPLRIVRYRALVTDVNGNKAATDWSEVNCIKPGTNSKLKQEILSSGYWSFPKDDGTIGGKAESQICSSI